MTAPVFDESDVKSELGVWLSGLESFLAAGINPFADHRSSRVLADSAKEFGLTHSTLLRCAKLNSRLLNLRRQAEQSQSTAISEIESGELDELSFALRDCVLLSGCMVRVEPLGFGEWKAWCNLLSEKFAGLAAFRKLIRFAEASGDEYLPEALKKLAGGEGGVLIENAEISLILPRFARILKWLSVIGKMLEADEPLKPALLIFSRVNEQINELIAYINNRLERFPNEEVELFASLDAAAYTASIELKKVYTQELAGLSRVRPSPSIYARMETAHSLLNESFQQILAGFAGLLDPKSNVFALFPNFQLKFEQSIVLRQDLWEMVQLVHAAEKNPVKQHTDEMNKSLREFMMQTVRFLYYKETDTVDRFVEEILVTKQKKDLVPILHRFGAYLETLFAQVNMRAVLEKHPFEAEKR